VTTVNGKEIPPGAQVLILIPEASGEVTKAADIAAAAAAETKE
jgi:hypothetical protein